MTLDRMLRGWGADPTGEQWHTGSADLAAGVRDGEPVMLKVARIEEERRGGRLMTWWSRCGGLPVRAASDDAILMTRATGLGSLLAMAEAGRVDEADGVLADTVLALHAMPAPPASVGLVPLAEWFHDLLDRPQHDPLLVRAAAIARDVLADDHPSVVLHGDLHHGNVLDLGDRWAAIDPKGLVGHPAFDVANVCCNPSEEIAVARIRRRIDLFSDRLMIEREVLTAWVIAWCGLSLAWNDEGWHARTCRRVAASLLA